MSILYEHNKRYSDVYMDEYMLVLKMSSKYKYCKYTHMYMYYILMCCNVQIPIDTLYIRIDNSAVLPYRNVRK
jgi:hypothetical protein